MVVYTMTDRDDYDQVQDATLGGVLNQLNPTHPRLTWTPGKRLVKPLNLPVLGEMLAAHLIIVRPAFRLEVASQDAVKVPSG